jgi:hypothetical protein
MASASRPGVEITQSISESSAVVASPTLVPCVVGVCYQLLEVLDDDGALESDAKFVDARYNQSSMLIAQADFPDPRDNIDELEFDEATTWAYLYFGGALTKLSRGSNSEYGQAFLKLGNLARAACIRSGVPTSIAFDSDTGDAFTFAIDVVNPTDTSKDVTVTLSGTLTIEEIVEEINDAAGKTVASVFMDADGDFGDADLEYLQIASTTYGATSSVTIRAGTAALTKLFGSSFASGSEYRVEGAGFCGQDDEDGDLYTPWIEFCRGDYLVDNVSTAWPDDSSAAPTNSVWAGTINLSGEFYNAAAGAVTFSGSSPTFPLKAATSTVPGDQFWASGAQVGGGEVIKIDETRFKLGKLSTTRSTYDDDGAATNRVYDTLEVNTLSHSSAFSPKYAYFKADGLVYGSVTPEGVAAEIEGSESGLPERAAMIMSSSDISFSSPLALSSLTLIFVVTEDGVEGDEVTFTLTGGPFSSVAEIIAAMEDSPGDEFSQCTLYAAGDRLVITTTKKGGDQAFSLKSTGTANTALGFSASVATEDTGKDVEFATQASVSSQTLQLPLSPSSASLALTITDAKGTHSLSATGVDLSAAADMDALVAAIATAFGGGSSDLTLYVNNDDSGIPVATVAVHEDSTGSDDYGKITITSIEGGSSVSVEVTATDTDDGMTWLGFYDSSQGSPAQIDSEATFANSLADDGSTDVVLDWTDGTDSYTITGDVTTAMTAAASASALCALFNADASFNGSTISGGDVLVHWFSDDDDIISVRTILGGAGMNLTVSASQAGFAAMNFDVTSGFDEDGVAGSATVQNADGDGDNGLKGATLTFELDDNPYEYEITFASNSLQDAIDDINDMVDGAEDVASEGDSRNMVLSSLLAGAASKVYVQDNNSADLLLGIDGTATGSGRPNPDFYLDSDGSINLGPNILRNKSSGIPFSLESGLADIYIAYEALRLDVSASAEDPALLVFDTVSDLEASIGPVSTKNPLALGTFLALAQAPTVSVSCLGIDEANDASPMGSIDGWARALEFLESSEVYAIAPLTDDQYVQGLLSLHVQTMSQPAERGERIVFLWSPVPDRAVDTTVISGEDGESNGTDNSFTLDSNPNSDLIAQGIDPSDEIEYDDQLYLEILITESGSSSLRRYSVSNVNGVVLSFRTTFAADENEDGFFTTETFDESVEGADWSLKIRGDELLIKGTTRRDLSAIASAMAEQGEIYANRRVYYLACDAVDTSINGVTQKIDGHYLSAAVAGQVAQQSPQQPLTNLPINGVSRVYGTDDTFSEKQLDTIADGGRYVMVNLGGAVVSRHQRSTATTSVEYQELSITKAIDWLAKGLRATNRVFIGRSVITSGFLDQLTMSNEGFLDYAEQLGAVRKALLTSLLQDEDNPDTVLIEVEVAPAYPCNKIKITVVS